MTKLVLCEGAEFGNGEIGENDAAADVEVVDPDLEEKDVIHERVHELMREDRDLIDKSSQAFVSYVRYYMEHHLKYIFKFKMLDIGDVANSFHLLSIPRIKEILGKKQGSFKYPK